MTTTLKARIQQLEPARRRRLKKVIKSAQRSASRPPMRSRVQFAMDCIIIPEGPFENYPWRPFYQPFAGRLLEYMDTWRRSDGKEFRRFAVTGCVQSGKTFNVVVINLCWHLFERNQSVIFLVPELSMAEKKWREEIEPVISKSPELRGYLPSKGRGSQGGFSNVMRFKNGARLEFMGATGSDARRSSSTAPVIMKTEVDRTDEAADASREAAPAVTVEDRAAAYGDLAYIYEECTMTITTGRINQQFHIGTATEDYGQCPHCKNYVLPKREHLVGLEDCDSDIAARESGCFICPSCSEILSEDDRSAMQSEAIPVCRGQTIRTGTDGCALIEGNLPATETFSYKWNAFQNRFWSTPLLAVKEWTSLYSDNPDDEDKQAKQKRWAEPAESEQFDITRLTMRILINKVSPLGFGRIPETAQWVTSALDVSSTFLHYAGRSWSHKEDKLTGHLHDCGRMQVEADKLGLEDAVLTALRNYRDNILIPGYFDDNGKKYVPGWTLIDAGWKERIIWRFVLECVQMGIYTIVPIIGRGQSDPSTPGTYKHPEAVDNKKIFWIGDECHLRKSSRYEQVFAQAGCPHPPLYVVCNSDELKSYVREGYQAPVGMNGSLTTCNASTAEERELLQQYRKETLAEMETKKYLDGRGSVSVWRNTNRQKNHYGDADYYNVPAAQLCGAPVTVRRRIQTPVAKPPESKHLTMPDGRPFMAVPSN